MPFSLKVTPVSVDDRVTVSVNGINKVVDAAIANISIPAVVEDLEINIQVNPKGSNAYTVVNVKEGELDAKIAQCPARLKVIGVMRSEDFDAFRKHAATIVDLDLADVTIKGAGDLANAIPSKAFASTGFCTDCVEDNHSSDKSCKHRRECFLPLCQPLGGHNSRICHLRRRQCVLIVCQIVEDCHFGHSASGHRIYESVSCKHRQYHT